MMAPIARMASRSATADEICRHSWDVIIVGTGIGGATLGLALAKAGLRILFCERGRSSIASANALTGEYPEQHGKHPGAILDQPEFELLRNAGRDAEEVIDQSSKRPRHFIPFLGSGTGGSSALYGMALERFFPADFTPRLNHPMVTETSLEERWPISYEELLPYYSAAEHLYRVRGTVDPLRPAAEQQRQFLVPPPITAGSDELFRFFAEKKGLHPYRLPMACEFVSGCRGCQGFLCAKECKNDSARICLTPALRDFGATLLDECEVLTVDADRSHVTGVICHWRGETIKIRAAVVVLAAGALQTPKILFRSRSSDWPDGLANGSGMVGRNLMRHFVDLYLIESKRAGDAAFENRFKELAFNDYYRLNGVKLGSVQSFGRLPPAPMLFASMVKDARDGSFPWIASALPLARPLLMAILDRMVSGTMALATTMEDLPYLDNRIVPEASAGVDGARVRISYRIKPEGHARISHFRRAMQEALRPLRWRLVKQAANNQRIAHVCGTCRFGLNPKTSVLDANNRAHELDNLYVVDGSFFPSSGGTNPSLTIAANALRVAEHLAR